MSKADPFIINYCQQRGRHIVATDSLPAGSLIFAKSPIAWALSTENITTRCHNCWLLAQDPLRCSSCQYARYCNVSCQKAAWPLHRIECRVINRVCIPWKVSPTPSLLVLFNVIVRQPSDPLSDLISNWELIPNQRKADFMQMSVLLNEMLSAVPDFRHAHSLESLAELFARHHCNSFTITDSELQPIGIGIYPNPVYLLNHSCRPNAVVIFEHASSQAVVKACRDIHPKEEITISYCDVIQEKQIRRAELLEQYYFTCSCSSCTEPEDSLMIRSTVKLQTRFIAMLDSEDYDSAENALSMINAESVYQSAPMLMGLHFLKLGKLRMFLEKSGARQCLNRALEILRKLLLPNDPVLTEAEQLRQEALSIRSN